MPKLYYFLSGLLAAIIVAVNIRSQGDFLDIQLVYCVIWIGIELIIGLIQDVNYLIKEARERGEEEDDEMRESEQMSKCR